MQNKTNISLNLTISVDDGDDRMDNFLKITCTQGQNAHMPHGP